jgi:hypothetical protein
MAKIFQMAKYIGIPNGLNIPNDHNMNKMAKVYQMRIKIPNDHLMYQNFPFQGVPNFTEIDFFLECKYTIWQP